LSVLLIVRPRDRWEESSALLKELGHQAVWASVVRVEYRVPSGLEETLEALRDGRFGSLVFASVTAVRSLQRAISGRSLLVHPGTELVAIGPPTARAMEAIGLSPVRVPDEYTSEGLVTVLRSGLGEVLMLRSDHGNAVLREGLAGTRPLKEVVMYSLHRDLDGSLDAALQRMRQGGIDAVLHTSSLSAQMVVERSQELFGEGWRDEWRTVNAAIGPPTAEALESFGLKVQVVPAQATFPQLVRAVDRYLASRESNKSGAQMTLS